MGVINMFMDGWGTEWNIEFVYDLFGGTEWG